MLLAEMGAEVIKIEAPGGGDDSRQWGSKVNGESLYFAHYNRGKKSCVINLKTGKGRDIFRRLAGTSDVVVENLRPGALKKLGLGYEDLRTINPRLIFCSITGFDGLGQLDDLAAYDIIIQGMSGLMSVTGEPDGEPLRVGLPIVDVVTGLFCAYAVGLALRWRDRFGVGQKVDVSLLGAALETVGQWISIYGGTGKVPGRSGNKYPLIAPYEPIKTMDGYLIVAVGNESHWEKLCKVINRPDLVGDPRFATNQVRIKTKNRSALLRELGLIFVQKTTDEWTAELWKEHIPAGPVNSIDKNVQDQSLFDAGLLVHVTHPRMGRLPFAGVVPRLGKSPGIVRGPSPLLGEHTLEILKGLGYSPKEIGDIVKSGAVEILGDKEMGDRSY